SLAGRPRPGGRGVACVAPAPVHIRGRIRRLALHAPTARDPWLARRPGIPARRVRSVANGCRRDPIAPFTAAHAPDGYGETESQPWVRNAPPPRPVSFRRPTEREPRDPETPQSQVVPMKVGVARETAAGERRVALVPEALGKLQAAGLEILVESGAGAGALIPDEAYKDAGATIVSAVELYAQSDVILRVQKPSADEVKVMRSGQAVVGFLAPLIDPQTAKALADQGVIAISLDAIPRTLSRAQSMDALSSQANVGGYTAGLIAARQFAS